jgi:hypothetical protein
MPAGSPEQVPVLCAATGKPQVSIFQHPASPLEVITATAKGRYGLLSQCQ